MATSLTKLEDGIADRWDSGKVVSDNSVEIPYSGGELVSGERVYWKVRVLDQRERWSDFSAPSYFEMGLTRPDDWRGVWIAAKNGISSPLLRREFSIDAPVRQARAYVSGLGYHEFYLNGRKVGDRVLEPASTYYHNDQHVQLSSRVPYSTYDVTADLKVGANALGVMLGHGWFSAESERLAPEWRDPYGDRPRLLLQLNIELMDGRRLVIVSDKDWESNPGPIIYNDLADGETYDARAEQAGWATDGFNDAGWEPVSTVDAPSGVRTSLGVPSTRVIETRPVVRELTPRGPAFSGTKLYDFGQNFSGWARIAVQGPRGARLRLTYAPRVYHEDQALDTRSSRDTPNGGARQADTYVLKGEGTEVWEPRFTLHGFRYLEISGLSDEIDVQKVEGRVVHSDLDATGSFSSSNPLLNRIHQNIQWTLRSNFQGIPQDAAERGERIAWLGDPGFTALEHLYGYDMAQFWEKWLVDIQDSQQQTGGLPWASPLHARSVPYAVWPTWQSTYPILVWSLYEFYGDRRVLEQHYENLKRLVEFQGAAAQRDLIASEFLGDHMEPQDDGETSFMSLRTPSALTASAYYYFNVRTLARVAEVLEKNVDEDTYSKRADRIKRSFNRRFFSVEKGLYATGSQASNALPLQLKLVPEDRAPTVVDRLIADIRRHGTRVTTGVVGTSALIDALSESGNASVLYELATQTTYPSLGDQIARGATTVCETYECNPWNSQNMKMFASWGRFLYRDLAGIAPMSPGYRHIRIAPQPVGDLRSVSATQQTVRGLISVDWTRTGTAFDLKVTIPAGTEANIAIPKMGLANPSINEGAATIWMSQAFVPGTSGLSGGMAAQNAVIFHAGSGTYHFRINGEAN